MKKALISFAVLAAIGASLWLVASEPASKRRPTDATDAAQITLPPAKTAGTMSLEEAISKRRSVRAYKPDALTPEQLSQVLWAAQGLSPRKQFMSHNCPSAGGIFPMDVYVLDKTGLYQYQPKNHSLKPIRSGDIRTGLCDAAYGQPYIKDAPVALVITGDIAKCAKRYGDRAPRYVAMEAGHIGQNISLEAVALGLGTVMIGAFDDEKVADVLGLPDNQSPMYIIPLGYPRE